MHIRELSGKNICVLGFGREGQATVRALETRVPDCEITIADSDEHVPPSAAHHGRRLGTGWLENLADFDVIIKSPGIPPQAAFGAVREKMTNATQIFLDTVREDEAVVIGVTGSKGKSTTASLIHAALIADGRNAFLVGNIGSPALDALEHAAPDTFFVLEMSSYQLTDLKTSPSIAVVTSFFPEHLDYHGGIDAYEDAKTNIARFQTEEDVIFFNVEQEGAKRIAFLSIGKKMQFSADDAPLPVGETHLLGRHNAGNMAAAWKVAEYLGITKETCLEAFRDFQGLPHRLQSLGLHHGLEWIDDSISTTPESAIAALDALGDRVTTILLGGQDRGYNFTELGKRIARSSVQNVILFPESGPRIRLALEKAAATVSIRDVSHMEQAVSLAKQTTSNQQPLRLRSGQAATSNIPIVLLSPASPSYGLFKNFEERGEMFKGEIVK
ncbi:MAG: UDP-N-acetylmuramoyl-L-alanine--D-glutamate ligase [Candidatus Peribacteraceae bacterium]|nr:UDP-N-acetylmuramoyl-L-alanine--D-glutamate ligase [Candidatus Peribacteraceae bacterium]